MLPIFYFILIIFSLFFNEVSTMKYLVKTFINKNPKQEIEILYSKSKFDTCVLNNLTLQNIETLMGSIIVYFVILCPLPFNKKLQFGDF